MTDQQITHKASDLKKHKSHLDQKLEIDIIGFWCCSFRFFVLTSCLKIDTLQVQFKRKKQWSFLHIQNRMITRLFKREQTMAASGLQHARLLHQGCCW